MARRALPRLDALAALFLIVANLGGAAARIFGLGYGRHEHERARVLPFYAAFLAGMNLVVLADDAFTFLLSWEFMSLASWALVMAHHKERGNAHAGYVYIVMASFGTLALLLVPVHAWLPLAHPAAPSHVSALMSGVMTKVAGRDDRVHDALRAVRDPSGPRHRRAGARRRLARRRAHAGADRHSVVVDRAHRRKPQLV